MRPLMQLALCGLLAAGTTLAAQHGGGRGGSIAAAPHGGGHQYGAVHTLRSGHRGGLGYGGYGFGYGGLYGGYDQPFYNTGDAPAMNAPDMPNTAIVYPASAEAAPAGPVHSVIHEYNQPEDYGAPAQAEYRPLLYLIAFQDKNIHAAMTYWVDGSTLFYLDQDHKEAHVPLAAVDRTLSTQLNRERRVPFNLP